MKTRIYAAPAVKGLIYLVMIWSKYLPKPLDYHAVVSSPVTEYKFCRKRLISSLRLSSKEFILAFL